MDYRKIYNNLIEKRKRQPLIKCGDATVETHHIIPVSYGGTNDKENKINLNVREHFVAHLLLYHEARKLGNNKNIASMACALIRMMTGRQNCYNSHFYKQLRESTDFGQFWRGREHKSESREKTRKVMTPKNSKNPRIWVCKDGVAKYVRKSTLQQFLKDGYELGRKGYKPRKGCQGKLL